MQFGCLLHSAPQQLSSLPRMRSLCSQKCLHKALLAAGRWAARVAGAVHEVWGCWGAEQSRAAASLLARVQGCLHQRGLGAGCLREEQQALKGMELLDVWFWNHGVDSSEAEAENSQARRTARCRARLLMPGEGVLCAGLAAAPGMQEVRLICPSCRNMLLLWGWLKLDPPALARVELSGERAVPVASHREQGGISAWWRGRGAPVEATCSALLLLFGARGMWNCLAACQDVFEQTFLQGGKPLSGCWRKGRKFKGRNSRVNPDGS